jgi:hypothetical protein
MLKSHVRPTVTVK